MELKCYDEGWVDRQKLCSNRTFMELKLTYDNENIPLLHGSNRTFMELKLPLKQDV